MTMPEFAWRAAQPDGTVVNGRLEAHDRDAALRALRARHLLPIALHDATSATARQPWQALSATFRGAARRPPRARDIQTLTAELAVMLQAGLSLDQALRTLRTMRSEPAIKTLLDAWLAAVKDGQSLSLALAPHRSVFGDFYIGIVRAGEAGGALASALEQLALHLERVQTLRDTLISALTYPLILLVVAVISVMLMLGVVVPQFEGLFAELGDALPLATRVIVAAGAWLSAYGLWLLGIALLTLLTLRHVLAREAGRRWVDTRLLALPLLGDILRSYDTTRFARSLGALLSNGVPIVGAIGIAGETIGNLHLRSAIDDVVPAIKEGQRLAVALERTGLFNPLALNMIRLGEETGRLDALLLELARIQDKDLETRVRRAITLLEPALILTLGGLIAAIMASILLGILTVNELAA